MRLKLLVGTIAAVAVLGASVADAASRKHKRKVYRHHPPIIVYGAPPAWHFGYGRVYPDHPPNRPAWTRGTECYTDEGYGRFSPCDMSRGLR